MDPPNSKDACGHTDEATVMSDHSDKGLATVIEEGTKQLIKDAKECISRGIAPHVNNFNDSLQAATSARGFQRQTAPLDALLGNEIEKQTNMMVEKLTKICIPLAPPNYDVPAVLKMK